MGKRVRAVGALVSACVVSLGVFVVSVGATVTQPNSNPFNVPGDSAGNPKPFAVEVDGFAPGVQVFIEQCDGKDTGAVDWNVNFDCDLGSATPPVLADAGGVATFPVGTAREFTPFKGESPQSLFNCVAASNDPPTTNGLTDWTNCQVRVSSNNTQATTDQQFFTLHLPKKPFSCDAQVQEQVKGPVRPTPSVKQGSVKSLKPSVKKNLIGSVAGTRVPGGSCGESGITGLKASISAGQILLKENTDVGWSCSNVMNPSLVPLKSQLQVKWEGVVDGKLKSVAKTKALIDTVTLVPGPVPAIDIVTQPVPLKNAFAGNRLALHLVSDQTAAELQIQCESLTGVAQLNFTGQRSLEHRGTAVSCKPKANRELTERRNT